MRCIEIKDNKQIQLKILLINRNMRCIEIFPNAESKQKAIWLIETWDVLKW